MRSIVMAFVAALLLAACGTDSSSPSGDAARLDLSTLPATVEGVLTIDVEEGDAEDDGLSSSNFGTLTVGDRELLVDVDGAVLRAAGVQRDRDERVRAVLGSKQEQYGQPMYKITSLSRL